MKFHTSWFLFMNLFFNKANAKYIVIAAIPPHAWIIYRALIDGDLTSKEIAEKAMKITAEICIYTNQNVAFEELKY